ncbi:hybrid sensor histidine kinase/response regulator [Lichenibacterium dinghuense]|uniref:hybrid sensor histidine kinase/response regulator n=1 Tax=Lichenibacterium dinghuense TaxID=2895977 RepID=UPI001F032AAB|nr:response regulator [Lichenibacterium sp. 6Y81]
MTLHEFLQSLYRHRSSAAFRHGVTVLVIGVISAVRYVLPLDTAPFLLYMPVIFLAGVALGRSPAIVGLVISTAFSAYFFQRSPPHGVLSVGQALALVQYVVIGGAMIMVCGALRNLIAQNEAALAAMSELNATLTANQATLAAAKEEAEAAKDTAEAANRAKSAFLANMSHELRTPLSAVIGYTEMIEEQAEDAGADDMLADLGKVKSNARHLLGLINDVLDLSKIEAAKMDVSAEEAEVAAFVRDAAVAVEAIVRRKGNALELDVPDDLGTMHTDVVKLRQCLFNLLSNAAKFTEGGRITLRVRRETVKGTAWLAFAVEDTGIGMTPEQVERLFQRFVQADESTTRRFGGTGLGLALSRGIAQLMGGDITVASVEGRGTTFTLRVPAVLPRPEEATDGTGPAAPENASGDLVLVVDDEPSQRELTTRFLERMNFVVRTAADGREGLDLARSLRPGAILLDVMMPGMDGWSVLQALKDDPATAQIPVVMVSFVSDAGLGLSLGAADSVPKPVDWGRLRAVMAQVREAGDVLVIDDDADTRRMLRGVLERQGWTVQEAGDGAEGLDRVLHAPPHVVLLDLTMPVMDGFGFLRRLRETPGCSDIPVVVFSARDLTTAERAELSLAEVTLKKGETSVEEVAAQVRRLDAQTVTTSAQA